jgi:surface protein
MIYKGQTPLLKQPKLGSNNIERIFLGANLVYGTKLPLLMVVKSDNSGSSSTNQFTLTGAEVSSGTTFDVTFSPISDIGNITSVTLDVSNPTITFPSIGSYIVRVDGRKFNRIQFNDGGDRLKLLTITQWGDIVWSSMLNAFRGCSNMNVTATDYPDLSRCNILESMFRDCSSLVATSDFNDWNVSNITNMLDMFRDATSFNQPIGNWDVSNVTTMRGMFQDATSFNQDISGWNTSNVTRMEVMFDSSAFNQPIGNWDVSKVVAMNVMFNQSPFNQDIGDWDVSNVNNMDAMFTQAPFNQDISGWNTSNVTNMNQMFNLTPFNQNIGGWDVSKVTTMSSMFQSANSFNQDISGWNTSNVTNMSQMFQFNTAFNQNISVWNVNKVTNFNSMFSGATLFNQNLGAWQLKTTATLPTFVSTFSGTGMSCANYTDTIVGWANYVNTNSAPKSRTLSGNSGRTFANDRSGGAAFADSAAARAYLTGALPDGGWTISGDTVAASC